MDNHTRLLFSFLQPVARFVPPFLLAAAFLPLCASADSPGAMSGPITPAWTNAFAVPVEDAALIAFRRSEAESHLLIEIGKWKGSASASLANKSSIAAKHEPDKAIHYNTVIELMMMADYVATEGKIPRKVEADVAKFLRMYEKQFKDEPETLPYGYHAAMTARSAALVEKVYSRRYPKIGKWLKAYWGLLMKSDTWDTGNGSNTADSLGALYHVALLKGWETQLAKNDHLKGFAEYFRDIVQPNGTVPAYGHGNPMQIYDVPFLLEAAGIIHKDPSFQYVADKVILYHRNVDTSNPIFNNPEYHRHLPRRALANLKPRPPRNRSFLYEMPAELNNKLGEEDIGRPAKLVLRTGHHPLSAYLFMDLAAGAGASIDQRQSIDGYGAQGIAHWMGHGRHFLGQETIGLIAGKSKKVKFPYTRAQFVDADYVEHKWPGPKDPDLATVWRMFSTDEEKPSLVIGKIDIEDRPFETSARIDFKVHGTGRGKAQKHILLTTEGILVIRDDYTAGSGLTGGIAGPIWYQHPTDAAINRLGDDWILQPTLKHRATLPGKRTYQNALLVKHGLAPGQRVMRGINYSVAAQAIRRNGEKMTFLTFAMPVDPKGDHEAMAKSVQTVVKPGGLTALRIRRGEKHTMTITIDPRGNWKVNRSPGSIIRGTPAMIPKPGTPPTLAAAVPGKPGTPAAAAAAAMPEGAVPGLDGKPLIIPEKMVTDLDQRMLEWISDYKEDLAKKPLMINGSRAQLLGVDLEAKAIKVRIGSRAGVFAFDKIPESDKGRIALDGTQMLEYNKEVNLLAGYYLVRAGKAAQSLPYLTKGKDAAKELRTLLGVKDSRGH